MNSLVGRLVRYHKCKFLPKKSLGILRLSTCDDPCPPKCPPPPIHVDGTCPQPPPCSDSPPTANRLCPYNPDPGNPCNYSPPACPDPEQPELTRLKKLQCRFQVDNDMPVFLKGGAFDNVIYQATIILNLAGLIMSFYALYSLLIKK